MFELPDVDFVYPGDVFRYHFENSASAITLPRDLSGFGPGWDQDSRFVVRGLPSFRLADGTQPELLFINCAGDRAEAAASKIAFRELALVEGVDYDSYTMRAPGRARSNGIGSAGGHGASIAHMNGYSTIILNSEDLFERVLSDGSGGLLQDESDDLGLLTAWHDLPGDRYAVFFGNNLCESNQRSPAGQTFNDSVLGVAYNGPRFDEETLGTRSPFVWPVSLPWHVSFVLNGSCRWVEDGFDDIVPIPSASNPHEYELLNATPSGIPASIVYDRLAGSDRKVDVTFPYGMGSIIEPSSRSSTALNARAYLLAETLEYFGRPAPIVTDVPAAFPSKVSVRAQPNPFNPRTVVEFSVPHDAVVSVAVFDLAGRRVKQLLPPSLHGAGIDHVIWDGTDAGGAGVASGVYVVHLEVGEEVVVQKVALVR